jgi:anaerobic selenocysteine-containing dehydrogenase
MKPVAIHQGEGINHWFHATEMNRAAYLPLMLTGNIGQPGAGCHTWAGNYKAALFQGSPWTGPGFKGWVAEDPFEMNLDPKAHGNEIHAHAYTKDEEPAYWNHGDLALIVNTPKFGRKNFTGQSHMPTPTKALLFNNVNLINNAKWAYGMIKNVNPNVELIVTMDTQMTASVEHSDFGLPANSWVEFEDLEITASCSNPFLQIWKGGIKPLYDSKDDLAILAGIANALYKVTGDKRFYDHFKFEHEGKRSIYIQRLLDIFRHGLDARRIRAAHGFVHLIGVTTAGDDVVRDVEIGGARPAVDRLPDRHLHVERDAVHVFDAMRPFAQRRRGQYLTLFLEGAHAVAIGLRRAADQQHRPAVLLRVGEARETVDHAGTGHDDA